MSILKSFNRYATAYSIQTSTDGMNWTTVYSTSSGDGGTDTISFLPTTACYVRLYTTAWTNEIEDTYLDEF